MLQVGGHAAPLVLSENDWETALRRELPSRLVDKMGTLGGRLVRSEDHRVQPRLVDYRHLLRPAQGTHILSTPFLVVE